MWEKTHTRVSNEELSSWEGKVIKLQAESEIKLKLQSELSEQKIKYDADLKELAEFRGSKVKFSDERDELEEKNKSF